MNMNEKEIKMLLKSVPNSCILYQIAEREMRLLGISKELLKLLSISEETYEQEKIQDPLQMVFEEDMDAVHKMVEAAFADKNSEQRAFRLVDQDGRMIWVYCQCKMVGNYEKKAVVLATMHRIKEIEQVFSNKTDLVMLERMTYFSEHDALTGIYNREKCFWECTKLREQHPDERFVMVNFDIQRFRLYNSFYGEEEGNKLLIYIAEMFKKLSKQHEYGIYGRIESDVFLLFFPYKKKIIEKNEVLIHKELKGYSTEFDVSGSAGVYISEPGDQQSVKDMFHFAEIASRNNRKKLMNRMGYFDDEMKQQLMEEKQIAAEMKKALKKKQFVVYLQPKYNTKTGESYGAEALVRWEHPEKGLISPARFIPLFERNGFIMELDQYMWEQVCVILHRWIEQGITPGPISVNVSRISMYNPRIVAVLKELVKKYNIPVELLQLELTESAYMDDPEKMKQRLSALQEAGFKIMMDDFGSGYSSLNTLRELPVDYLKVDRMFLASIDHDQRGRVLLTAVIHMANWLHIPVIAEGIETKGQQEFLSSIGCDYMQGYLFARPMPVCEYEEKKLNQLAYLDSLTSAFNRRYFEEGKYMRTIDYVPEFQDSIAFVRVEVRHLEKINTRYGVRTGNQILTELAEQIRMNIRSTDSLIRYAEGEFIVVLYHCGKERLFIQIERMEKVIDGITYGEGAKVEVQIGYSYRSHFKYNKKEAEQMVHEAE